MVLRLRQPERRRFKSTLRDAHRRQREYYYAAVSVLVVKIILLFFLGILCYVSLRLFPYRFPAGTFAVRYGVPVVVAAFMLVLLRVIYSNIKELRENRPSRRR